MSKKMTLFFIGAVILLVSAINSGLSIALPQITGTFGLSSGQSALVVTVGMATMVIFAVALGRFGDLFSKNLIFTLGGWIFSIASLLAGFSYQFVFLIICLFLQAIGSAMIFSTAMGLIMDAFSDQKQTQALAYNSVLLSLGGLLGPVGSGLVISSLGWHWLFWTIAVLGIFLMLMSRKMIRLEKIKLGEIGKALRTSNWKGQGVFTLGVVVIFASTLVKLPFLNALENFLVFVILGAALIVWSFVQDDFSLIPWISPKVLRSSDFLTSNGVLFFSMLAYGVSVVLLPFYFQNFLGYSASFSGLMSGLNSLITFLIQPLIGEVTVEKRQHSLVIIGLSILLLSQVGYVFFPHSQELVPIICVTVFNGVGWAFLLSPNNALGMTDVTKNTRGVAGSLNTVFRMLGSALGINFATSFFSFLLPDAKHISIGLATGFMNAFRLNFVVAIIISLIPFGIVFWGRKQLKAR